MPTLNAKTLTLHEVHQLLNLQEQSSSDSFATLLALEPLTEFEQKELWEIRQDFLRYLSAGKVSEGQVKFIAVAPLMRLAGFYKAPIEIILEENIEDITIEEEDPIVTGRFDILAVSNERSTTGVPGFWVLVIEAKNSTVEIRQGLPQLLCYAFKSIEKQSSVWGMLTNGLRYELVYLRQSNPPSYQILTDLILSDTERSIQLLQVLKAICKLQN